MNDTTMKQHITEPASPQVVTTLTDHMKSEYMRAAHALYKRGANAEGTLLSVVAAIGTATDPARRAQFDRAADAYRAWLVFDEPQASA